MYPVVNSMLNDMHPGACLYNVFSLAVDSPLRYNSHDFQEGTVTDFVLANTGAKSHEGNATLESVAGISLDW